jgi:hypothetical protein
MANCTPFPKSTLPLPCLDFLPADRACWPEEGSSEVELEARCSRLGDDNVGTGERGGSGATGRTNLGGGGGALAAFWGAGVGVGVVAAAGAAVVTTGLGVGKTAMGDGC